MCDGMNQGSLTDIHRALAEIPEDLRADVVKNIIHDIGIIAKAISIAENRTVA